MIAPSHESLGEPRTQKEGEVTSSQQKIFKNYSSIQFFDKPKFS
jgi:hypothetical protein